MKGVKRNKKLSAIFPGKLIVQTIALRSYFAVAEANTYITISNGFLALINLWLITNKEFHLPAKAELTINALSFPTYAQLKNSQYDVCIQGPGKKEKKLTGEILVKTNSPSLPPLPFSPFAGSNDKKNSQVLLFVEGVKQKKFISL